MHKLEASEIDAKISFDQGQLSGIERLSRSKQNPAMIRRALFLMAT